jgi:hypothetical protein
MQYVEISTKVCKQCHQQKSTFEFYRNGGMKDGFESRCVLCTRGSTRAELTWRRNSDAYKEALRVAARRRESRKRSNCNLATTEACHTKQTMLEISGNKGGFQKKVAANEASAQQGVEHHAYNVEKIKVCYKCMQLIPRSEFSSSGNCMDCHISSQAIVCPLRTTNADSDGSRPDRKLCGMYNKEKSTVEFCARGSGRDELNEWKLRHAGKAGQRFVVDPMSSKFSNCSPPAMKVCTACHKVLPTSEFRSFSLNITKDTRVDKCVRCIVSTMHRRRDLERDAYSLGKTKVCSLCAEMKPWSEFLFYNCTVFPSASCLDCRNLRHLRTTGRRCVCTCADSCQCNRLVVIDYNNNNKAVTSS